jgi:hypothetical protein
MAKNTKVLTVLSTAAVTGLITAALGSTAFAKTSAILVQNGSNDYKYDYSSLASAFEDYSANPSNGALYQDYLKQLGGKSPVALYDDVQKTYIDYTKVASAFEDAQAKTTPFNLNAFTEASKDTYAPVAPIYDASVGSDGKISYIIEPDTNKLAVNSVTATNLKTATINFNTAVDAKTVTADTVKVYTGTNTVAKTVAADPTSLSGDVVGYNLSNDGKTLTVEFNNYLPQATSLKVTVDGVKSADDKTSVSGYTNTSVVTDTTFPVANSVNVLDAKDIQVQFSEPINITPSTSYSLLNNVKIDGVAAIAQVSVNNAKNTVTFGLSTALKAGAHKIDVAQLSDFASLPITEKSFDFNISDDTTAPKLIGSQVIDKNNIQLTFDEPVNAIGTFKVNGLSAAPTYVTGSDKKQIKLALATPLDLSAIVQIEVKYQGQADVIGNTIKDELTYDFKTADDTTLPTVAATVGTGNKVTLTFSKPMLTSTGSIQVLNKDGNSVASFGIPASFKADTNNTVLELSAAQLGLANIDGGTYTLDIKGMKDASIRANLLPEQKIAINAIDSKLPVITTTYLAKAGTLTGTSLGTDDTVTFYFSEAMDQDTLKNLSNYVVSGGNSFAAMSGVSVKSIAADGKSVTITYPNASSTLPTPTFTLYSLKDLAGNIANPTTVTKLSAATSNLAVPTTAVATATNKVTVAFNTPIASIDPSFIKIQDSSNNDYAVPVAADISSTDPTKVTFTLNKDLASTDTTGYKVVGNNVTLATNIYGSSLASGSTIAIGTITDNIAPTITKEESTASNSITVSFSEGVTLDPNDLVLKDNTGALLKPGTDYNVAPAGSSATITFLAGTSLADGTDAVTIGMPAPRNTHDGASNPMSIVADQSVSVNISKSLIGHTATVASILGTGTTVTPSVDGTSATITLSTAASAEQVSSVATATTQAEANKVTSVVVNGTNIVIPTVTGSTDVDRDALALNILKAFNSSASLTDAMSTLSGKTIVVNGVSYTIK